MKIGEAATLLRCQVARRRAQESDIHEWTWEDGASAGSVRFVPPAGGKPVSASLGPRSEKFVLRQYDLLIATGGTPNTVGAMAFAALRPERRIIAGKNLIVLRPNMRLIDPIWLYYRLAQPDIRKRLADSAAGKRSMYLPVDAISDLEVRMPEAAEIESVHAIHKTFLDGYRASSARIEKERREWEKLIQLMTGGM